MELRIAAGRRSMRIWAMHIIAADPRQVREGDAVA